MVITLTFNPAKIACTGTIAWQLAIVVILLGISPALCSAAVPTKSSKTTVQTKVASKGTKASTKVNKIKTVTKKTAKTSKPAVTGSKAKAKATQEKTSKGKTIAVKDKSKPAEVKVATKAQEKTTEAEIMQAEKIALAEIQAAIAPTVVLPPIANDGAVSIKDVYQHQQVVPTLVARADANFPKFTWSETTSPLQCKLRYGNSKHVAIEFSQKFGTAEKLLIDLSSSVGFQPGIAKLLLSPATGQSLGAQMAWQFKIAEDKKPIIFSTAQAQQLMAALGDGMQPSITQQNVELVKFDINSALLDQPYLAYVQCQQKLVTASWDDVKNSEIYFASDSTLLNRDALQWLQDVIAYAKDLKNYKIKLIGYMDSFGNASVNEKVSVARVNRVASYLRVAGIQDERVAIQIKLEENLGAKLDEISQAAPDDSDNYGERKPNKRVGIKISQD